MNRYRSRLWLERQPPRVPRLERTGARERDRQTDRETQRGERERQRETD